MSNGAQASWSNRALKNYQRARSSDITITRADGSTSILTKREAQDARKAAYRARAKAKRKRGSRTTT